MPLLRCCAFILFLFSACTPALAQGDVPAASVTPAPEAAKQSDPNAARRQIDPNTYFHEAFATNVALLLRRADVRRELRVTEKQNALLTPMFVGNGQDAPDRIELGLYSQIGDVLNTKQVHRLRELDCQWRGPLLLFNADVAKYLHLTETQRLGLQRAYGELNTNIKEDYLKVRTVVKTYNEKYPPQQGPIPPDAKVRMKKEIAVEEVKAHQQIRSDILKAEDQILALLDSTQKTQWKNLLGKTFVFEVPVTQQ